MVTSTRIKKATVGLKNVKKFKNPANSSSSNDNDDNMNDDDGSDDDDDDT